MFQFRAIYRAVHWCIVRLLSTPKLLYFYFQKPGQGIAEGVQHEQILIDSTEASRTVYVIAFMYFS